MFEGWVINKDHINNDDYAEYNREGYGQYCEEQVEDTATSIFGTIYVSEELDAKEVENPIKFKLYDDDGELYYSGVISDKWLNEGSEIHAFAPLHFALTDAGATEMHYKEGNEWKVL